MSKIKNNIEQNITLEQIQVKLKFIALIIQLYFLGKKISISTYFNLIVIKIDKLSACLYILNTFINFFTLYPL